MFVLILIGILIFLCYLLLKKDLSYWKSRGIPYEEPTVLVGNIGKSFLMRRNIGEIINDIYRKYEGYPFVGIYRSQTPCLLVRDPELIKNIMIKDFKSFAHNDIYVDKKVDPILGRNPFVVNDEEWKSRRAQLTPAFTSGRMRAMVPLLEAVGERMVKYVEKLKQGPDGSGIDVKELGAKFTIDNVASCAFGLEGRCFEEEKSDFRVLAEQFISPDGWTAFAFLLLTTFPSLTKYISVKIVKKKVEDRLLDIVRQALDYRKKNNIVRPDFLDFVAKLEYETKNLREIDITSHAASFFADGFETSSNVMSYLLFELANNSDVQEILRQEINTVLEKKHDGKFSYDAIQDMPYLHACLYESMRKNPFMGFLSKKCSQSYSYTPSESEFKNISVNFEPGDRVIIPFGIHLNPKYYPEPNKFKPERFLNNTNKSLCIVFGEGPRVCLESMRKNPFMGFLSKKCSQSYSYTPSESEFKNISVNFEPGDRVIIPFGIHLDPKYYPEPNKFKPERFLNNTNKSLCIVFGEGPRVCLGQRFGQLQIKLGVAYLVKNFKLSVNKKTQYPFEYLPHYPIYVPKSGIWLNFE